MEQQEQRDFFVISNQNWPAPTAIFGILLFTGLLIIAASRKHHVTVQSSTRIRRKIAERRLKREKNIKEIKKEYLLDDDAKYIVSLPVDQLIQRLQDRSFTAVQVLKAYYAKSVTIHVSFNCITEFVPNSLEYAKILDALPNVKGPLHGVPICIKDDHNIEGMDSTIGLGKYLDDPAPKNSTLVQALIDLGAVPFCKTNIPQTLFSWGGDNPIFGETLNHRNKNLTPGGSSCGTACLVGAGGACFGTGTDIAGSVRIPAHFSGISTLKPTLNRLSCEGIREALPKCVGFKGTPGILAKEAKTVALVMQALTQNEIQNKYDPLTVPIPWKSEIFESRTPLRIGYYVSLSFFPPIGDTVDTVLKAKSALESLGHTVVPFTIENDWNVMKLMNDVVSIDFGDQSHLNKLFNNEPEVKILEGLRATCGLPPWRRKLNSYLSSAPGNSFSKRNTMLSKGGLDQTKPIDVWELMSQRCDLISTILDDIQKDNLDLLLTPAFPFPACRLKDVGPLFGAVVYTMLWNFVDFPAGVVPYGVETGNLVDSYDDEGDAMLRLAKESTKESVGSPIGVQLIAPGNKDELVLRAMVQLASTTNQN